MFSNRRLRSYGKPMLSNHLLLTMASRCPKNITSVYDYGKPMLSYRRLYNYGKPVFSNRWRSIYGKLMLSNHPYSDYDKQILSHYPRAQSLVSNQISWFSVIFFYRWSASSIQLVRVVSQWLPHLALLLWVHSAPYGALEGFSEVLGVLQRSDHSVRRERKERQGLYTFMQLTKNNKQTKTKKKQKKHTHTHTQKKQQQKTNNNHKLKNAVLFYSPYPSPLPAPTPPPAKKEKKKKKSRGTRIRVIWVNSLLAEF